jgi:hypothetical protein
MPKQGGARWLGAVEEDGDAIGIGQREVGDEVDGRARMAVTGGIKDITVGMRIHQGGGLRARGASMG